ncbi:MAG TPA: FAD-dependent oxidoreductase, partial [Planctomicrobium sp.]|nr:FAD-dependent oxidoreductase [Planctomicrobium sp.]
DTGQGASHVAAGLMTPLSGPKLTLTWGWKSAWSRARAFYQKIEKETGTSLLKTVPAVKLCASDGQFEECRRNREKNAQIISTRIPVPIVNEEWFHHAHRAIEQPDAARLDIPLFLEVSKKSLLAEKSLVFKSFDEQCDLEIEQDRLCFPRLQRTAGTIVFCQGFNAGHPWFGEVQFNPAKGQMLKLKADQITENRAIHHQIWLIQTGQDEFQVGATFEWDQLDSLPTASGRAQLQRRLEDVVKFPYEVIDQLAGVRPTMKDFRPVIGRHPLQPRLAILNGLGTKGSLWGPWMAELLTQSLLYQAPIPAELDVQRWFR